MPRALFLLSFGLLLLVGCGSRAKTALDPVTSATQMLQGSWRVESFTPDATLELPLHGLLQAQLGSLIVSFQGTQFSAAGPGLNTTGQFKVWSAANDQLSGTIYDASGVGYRIAGQFEGSGFSFRSLDAPWKGQGRLVR